MFSGITDDAKARPLVLQMTGWKPPASQSAAGVVVRLRSHEL
jgi:hypothetical protein